MTECSIPSSDGATHLPPLSSAAAAVEAHFQAHWSALDAAARQDPARVIAVGDWRSPLELPFLWLGDVPWCRLRQAASPPIRPHLRQPRRSQQVRAQLQAYQKIYIFFNDVIHYGSTSRRYVSEKYFPHRKVNNSYTSTKFQM
uniref:DOG1 domain-containing protein n=1 Tax=Zea mays TaxID=4577 RepID=A0A804QE02_MAIZE